MVSMFLEGFDLRLTFSSIISPRYLATSDGSAKRGTD